MTTTKKQVQPNAESVFGRLWKWVKSNGIVLVVVIPLLIAFGVFVYQARTPIRLSRYQTHEILIVTGNSVNQSRAITLTMVYPEELLLEETSKPGRPIHVWLSDPNPSDPPPKYTVILEPLADGLVFTGENGTPVTPSATLSATKFPLESSSWFLHRTPGVATQPASVDVKPSILTPDGIPLLVTPETIPIGLETSRNAFWRHFADQVFGPTTPLLGLALTLTVWFWDVRKKQREQEEKLKDERREREMAHVDSLWTANPTDAARRYLQLRKEAPSDQDMKAFDKECIRRGWQARIEQEAIASLARGEYEMAHDLKQEPCRTGSTDEPSAACDILNLLSGPLPSSEEKIRTLIALATKRGDLLPKTLVQRLAGTFEHTISEEGALRMVETEVRNQPAADWLVQFPSLQRHLRDWISAKRPDWEAAAQLLNWAYKRVACPPLWPSPNATVELERGIARACEKRRWPADPFGPDRVEQETRPLGELWMTSPVWNDLRALHPVTLLSEPGAGQTFALRYLMQTHSEQWLRLHFDDRSVKAEPLLLPVLLDHEVLLRAHAQEEYVGEIAFAIGQALLDSLALNPFLFEQSTPPAQHAIARLILACQHRLGELNGYVQRYLAERDRADWVVPLWLPDLLRDAAAGAQPVALHNPPEVWFALKNARLAMSQGFVVAVDIPAGLSERFEVAWLARRLRPLVGLMPDLAQRGVFLKLGLPAMVDGSALRIAAGSRPIPLAKWPDKQLTKLLKKRLRQADGFDDLMDRGEDIILSQWIVQRAQGSPQRLVRLGSRLLACYGDKSANKKLVEQDLAAVDVVP